MICWKSWRICQSARRVDGLGRVTHQTICNHAFMNIVSFPRDLSCKAEACNYRTKYVVGLVFKQIFVRSLPQDGHSNLLPEGCPI